MFLRSLLRVWRHHFQAAEPAFGRAVACVAQAVAEREDVANVAFQIERAFDVGPRQYAQTGVGHGLEAGRLVQPHAYRDIADRTDLLAVPQFDDERQAGGFQPPPHLMNQQLIQHHALLRKQAARCCRGFTA